MRGVLSVPITLATPRYVGRNLAHRRTSKDMKACNSRGLRMLTFQAASNQEQRILPSFPPTPYLKAAEVC